MTAQFWTPKCMWPSQVDKPSADDGAIVLCNSTADYLADGYSYCEKHVQAFIQGNIDAAEGQCATAEYDDDATRSPEQLQDDIDNWNRGLTDEWSFNGGGDE